MLSGMSLEVVLIVLVVSIVFRKAVWDSPWLALLLLLLLLMLLLLVFIIRFRGVIIPGISILRHGAHVCKEGL